MPREGVQTRAQRKKKAASGAPESPIQMLPLERPRKSRARKATVARDTTSENTSIAASGSETERAEEPTQSQESSQEPPQELMQGPPLELTQEPAQELAQEPAQEKARAHSSATDDATNAQDTQRTHEQVDTLEPTNSETITSSLTPDNKVSSPPASTAPAAVRYPDVSAAAIAGLSIAQVAALLPLALNSGRSQPLLLTQPHQQVLDLIGVCCQIKLVKVLSSWACNPDRRACLIPFARSRAQTR